MKKFTTYEIMRSINPNSTPIHKLFDCPVANKIKVNTQKGGNANKYMEFRWVLTETSKFVYSPFFVFM